MGWVILGVVVVGGILIYAFYQLSQSRNAPSPPPQPRGMPDWDNMDWTDLSPSQQSEWGTLGWDRQSWDANTPPASASKSWEELSDAERNAAQALGFTEATWVDTIPITVTPDWDNMDWTDLSLDQQSQWGTLGWDRQSWLEVDLERKRIALSARSAREGPSSITR